MAWESVSFVCSGCGKRGTLIYDEAKHPYIGDMLIKSITEGFAVKNACDLHRSQITCEKCAIVVKG
jgi:hypothetical protein